MTPEIIERRAADHTQAKLYVISGLTLTVIVIVAIVVLTVTAEPDQDRSTVIAILIGLVPSTLASLYAAIKSSESTTKQDITLRKVGELTDNVDGKMSQLLEARGQVAHAEGRAQGAMEAVAAVTAVQADPATAGSAVVVIPPVPPSSEPKS